MISVKKYDHLIRELHEHIWNLQSVFDMHSTDISVINEENFHLKYGIKKVLLMDFIV